MTQPRDRILQRKREYYDQQIQRHGCTALAAGWNSQESQELRFRQLLKIADRSTPFSIIDFGCGYGALADYLQTEEYSFQYCGYDISPEMITKAKELHGNTDHISFVGCEADLKPADYTVASGIFNSKFETSTPEWEDYILETLTTLDGLSRKGFAFNVLSKFSDEHLKRAELYYADPAFLFEYCRNNFSRFVTLLHDYPLYEFTILVRKTSEPR